MTNCRQGMQRKKRTEQLSIGNGKVMRFKLIKREGNLLELKGFLSASKCASKKLLQTITKAVLWVHGKVVNVTKIRST